MRRNDRSRTQLLDESLEGLVVQETGGIFWQVELLSLNLFPEFHDEEEEEERNVPERT